MKKEKQKKNWLELLSKTSKDGVEYRNWVIGIGKQYLEERDNRSIFTRIMVMLFGDPDILGEDIIKEYGEDNIKNYTYF